MKSITVSDLRNHLKEVLTSVKDGVVYEITQRGKVIATLAAPISEQVQFEKELAHLRMTTSIDGDIVNSPLPYKEWGDFDELNSQVAEPSPYD